MLGDWGCWEGVVFVVCFVFEFCVMRGGWVGVEIDLQRGKYCSPQSTRSTASGEQETLMVSGGTPIVGKATFTRSGWMPDA
jgi:hypothetical protein